MRQGGGDRGNGARFPPGPRPPGHPARRLPRADPPGPPPRPSRGHPRPGRARRGAVDPFRGKRRGGGRHHPLLLRGPRDGAQGARDELPRFHPRGHHLQGIGDAGGGGAGAAAGSPADRDGLPLPGAGPAPREGERAVVCPAGGGEDRGDPGGHRRGRGADDHDQRPAPLPHPRRGGGPDHVQDPRLPLPEHHEPVHERLHLLPEAARLPREGAPAEIARGADRRGGARRESGTRRGSTRSSSAASGSRCCASPR